MNLSDLFAIPVSYGLGCLVTGYYLVRWRTGRDIRKEGSGSVGARNVGRVLGRKGFWVTLMCDAFRGAIAVELARRLGASPAGVAWSLPAVAAGHIFPLQLGFRGGKGVAVSIGALSLLDLRVAAGWMLAFSIVFLCTRRYILSGMISIFLIPLIAATLGLSPMTLIALMMLVGLIHLAHRKNIAELFNRKMSRIPPEGSGG